MPRVLLVLLLVCAEASQGQYLPLPPRPPDAPGGSELALSLALLPRDEREQAVYSQVIAGNVPEFQRRLIPVTLSGTVGGNPRQATVFVLPDYLALGRDTDYLMMPMSALCAQRVANALGCTLPTRKLVDTIYARSLVKLRPQPIAPSAAMITVPVFAAHNDSVLTQRAMFLAEHSLGALVGGDKKDVIISNLITTNLKPTVPKPVVIYGWHQLNGSPIQPPYNGHEETYADYSHGVRLLLDSVVVDGLPMRVTDLLRDPVLCALLSDEGVIAQPSYSLSSLRPPTPGSFGVVPVDGSTLRVLLDPAAGTEYWAHLSSDGVNFRDSVELSVSGFLLDWVADSILYVRLRAKDETGSSLLSETLAGIPQSVPPEVLIVHGFDRASAGNTKNFIRMHAPSIRAARRGFASATNDAVLRGLISLSAYRFADYILGDESTVDEAFSSAEQIVVREYLQNGGVLIATGSEIAWDLDARGTVADSLFLVECLRARYLLDAPNNQAGSWYQAEGVQGGPFQELSTISFDDGTHGTINVRYPDVIEAVEGGTPALTYKGVPGAVAGVVFRSSRGGTVVGGSAYVAFPLESVYPASLRDSVFQQLFAFFTSPHGVGGDPPGFPSRLSLSQNYPNPFNGRTVISYRLPADSHAVLRIHDMLGREVATLVNGPEEAGEHSVSFETGRGPGTPLASGVYVYTLRAGEERLSRAMLLVR